MELHVPGRVVLNVLDVFLEQKEVSPQRVWSVSPFGFKLTKLYVSHAVCTALSETTWISMWQVAVKFAQLCWSRVERELLFGLWEREQE